MIRKSILVLALMAITSVAGLAAEYYWNVASGDWSVGSNWDPSAPASSGWAIIGNGGTANIDVDIVKSDTYQMRVFDGTVNHATYDVEVGILMVGGEDGHGYYNFSSGTLDVVSTFYMGYTQGRGWFDMSGGTMNTQGFVIGNAADSFSLFTITDGTLNVDANMVVGNNASYGYATLLQQGGDVNIGGDLMISNFDSNPFSTCSGYGAYKLEGGTLDVDGNVYVGTYDAVNYGFMKLKDGWVTVAGDFIVTNTNSIVTDICANHIDHVTLVVYGEFVNNSTANTYFSLAHTTLIMAGGGIGFDAGANDWDKTVINMGAVVDYGEDLYGLVNNYAVGDLVFKGTDTGSIWYVLESDIYCYGLRIEAGAVVDLNGYNIYYMPIDSMSYNGSRPTTSGIEGIYGDLTGSGANIYMLTPTGYVPEPGTIVH